MHFKLIIIIIIIIVITITTIIMIIIITITIIISKLYTTQWRFDEVMGDKSKL